MCAARREQGVWVDALDQRATIIVNADGTPVSAGGGGGVSYVDDATFTVGVSSLTPVGGVVSADTVDSGDAGAFAMLANRQQIVTLYSAAGAEITSFGGGTEYTVNAVAPANPVGATFVMERDDALSALAEVEGDWTNPRSNANGALWVAHDGALAVTGSFFQATQPVSLASVPSHAVTNVGAFVVQEDGAALTALQLIDDIVYTDDTSTHATGTSKGALIMAAATPTDTAVNANDIGAVGMTNTRSLYVSVQDALPAGANAIGKLAANAGVTIGAVEIAAAQTLATVTTVATVTALTTLTGGGIAHDGADSGNPVKVGGRARSSEMAAVANNDRADFITDLVGKQIVLPYANPENFTSGAITSAMTGTTSTSLLSAPASGLRNYITTIICSNAHATVGTDIVIQDGNGGATLLTIPAAAVYGGAAITLPVPLRQPTTATAIYAANVTTGASTKVSVVGYQGA